MSPMSPGEDFSPKLLVLGRDNTCRSIMLEALLEDEQNRFGVESAGIDPARRPDPDALKTLDRAGLEDVDLRTLQSTPISAALNEHIKLVVYVAQSIKDDAPIIATAGDKLTLDVPTIETLRNEDEDPEAYRKLLDFLRNESVPAIVEEELGLNA